MTKFVIHVYGPDDLHPFDDEFKALREANKLNAMFVRERAKHPNDDNCPICWAVVEESHD